MADQNIVKFSMSRKNPSRPWGFVMQGGVEKGLPVYVQKCKPGSISYKAGLRIGDAVCMINETNVTRHRLDQAKMEVTRSANDLAFIVQRGIIDMSNPVFQFPNERAEVEEDDPLKASMAAPTPHPPGYDAAVQSRSFRMLQDMVSADEAQQHPTPPQQQQRHAHQQHAAGGTSDF